MRSLWPVAFSLCVAPLPAQLFVVDPLGGGTHTDLQTAINAAPSGAVIRVRGGAWGPLTITRSVTIVGENAPRISSPFNNSGSGSQPPGITLQGTGTQTAVLAGLHVSGQANGFWWNQPGPGIASSGFARIAVHDCTLRGHDWWSSSITGTANGASGIVVNGPATLQVARSVIAASRAYPYPNSLSVPSGAHAINAFTATVVVLDSTVTGGSVDPIVWNIGSPWPGPCPCGAPGQEPGRGGAGVVGAVVFASGGTITGGTGAPVQNGMPAVPFGNQPNGAPIVANAQTTFATSLSQVTPVRLGSVHTIGFAPTSAPSLMAIGSPLPWPTPVLGIQLAFVDIAQPLTVLFLPVPSTTLSLPVPANVQLLGIEITAQRFDLGANGALSATNPLLAVVLP